MASNGKSYSHHWTKGVCVYVCVSESNYHHVIAEWKESERERERVCVSTFINRRGKNSERYAFEAVQRRENKCKRITVVVV